MIFNKVRSISFDKYFEFVRPQYLYIQIIPHKSIRNYNSSNIAKAIAHTYRGINNRIRKQQKKLFFETSFKISYIIDIEGGNANFYFLVPKVFLNIILEKIKEIWNKATINILQEGIKEFDKNTDCYEISYKKEDALSLAIDKKSNEPLNSILSTMDIMKEEDRITLIYNFMPSSQLGWIERYDETMDRARKKKCLDKQTMTVGYIVKITVATALNIMDGVMEVLNDFFGGEKLDDKESLYASIMGVLDQQKEVSTNTKKKKEQTILPTQIAVYSSSSDETRKENNALSVCSSFRTLDEDNELKYKKTNSITNIENYSLNTKTSIFSTEEISNFIQIPGRSLLLMHRIKHIQTEENEVPETLREGYFLLGESSCKGNKVNGYLEDEYNVGSYPLVANGSQGSGKSTYIANIYKFARTRGEGGVLIDYIKNNELTQEVLKYIPKENVILLDYSDEKCMQGFAFNEVANLKQNSVFERVKNANLQVMQFVELVNAINDEAYPLQARMRKYLVSAGTIVFCTGETSLKAIIDCLEDHNRRAYYISKLDKELLPLLNDKIKILNELDEWSKITKKESDEGVIPEVIGTKDSRIDGILDRVSLLKEDVALEYMFNKGSANNIDFAKELENGKLIIVKMLQDEWSSQAKDVISTFFISKIWLATEIRGKWNKQPKRSHIAIDEIFQCPTAMAMLSKKNTLPQTRKFGCKFIFTTQGLQQLKSLFTSIVDAGGTFMFLKGTKEEDFNLLKSKIEGYEYEDLRDMAQTYKFPSLNLVYYSGGYASFITKLPKPV